MGFHFLHARRNEAARGRGGTGEGEQEEEEEEEEVRGNRVHERMKGRGIDRGLSARVAPSSDIECQSSYLSDKAHLARISDGAGRGGGGGSVSEMYPSARLSAEIAEGGRPPRRGPRRRHRVIARRGLEIASRNSS